MEVHLTWEMTLPPRLLRAALPSLRGHPATPRRMNCGQRAGDVVPTIPIPEESAG